MCRRVQTRPPPYSQHLFLFACILWTQNFLGFEAAIEWLPHSFICGFRPYVIKINSGALQHCTCQTCQLICQILGITAQSAWVCCHIHSLVVYFHSYAWCSFVIPFKVVPLPSWEVLQDGVVQMCAFIFDCCMYTKLRWFLWHELP